MMYRRGRHKRTGFFSTCLAMALVVLGSGLRAQSIEYYDRVEDSLVRAGKAEQVLPFFLKELKAKPKNEGLLRNLGFYYISHNQPELCEKYYREALTVNPACGMCYLNLGKVYSIKGEHKKALDLMNQAVTTEPGNAALYYTRAQQNEIMHDKTGAIMDYNKAIKLDPNVAEYYRRRGMYNSSLGYSSLALADLDEAVKLAPENVDAYFERARMYYESQQLRQALDDMNKAIRIDSTRPDLYNGRGAIYSALKDHEQAILDFNAAIRLGSTDFTTYYNRGLSKYGLEDMDGSCSDTREALAVLLKQDPENSGRSELETVIANYCDSARASYYYQRGIASYNLGHFEKAITHYTAGLKKFPVNAMMLSFRGNAHYAAGHYAQALEDYAASEKNKENVAADFMFNQARTKYNPDSLSVYVNNFIASMQVSVAECYFALGQHESALAAVNKGMALATPLKEFGKENYYNLRGFILLAQGKHQQAIGDFNEALALNSRFVPGYTNRAMAKISMSSRVKINYYLSGKNGATAFQSTWTTPAKASVKGSDASLVSALNDCNKAIELDPASGAAYYTRGRIKKLLMYGDHCIDLVKAKQLAYEVEPEVLSECLK